MAGTIRIYGAGGCGINLAKPWYGQQPQEGRAEVAVTFVDTSHSNMDDSIRDEDCFVLPDVDGSGKVRKENYEGISNTVNQIIGQFKPADLNVVIFSTSGGSGSVAGPLLVREMIQQKLPVLCIAVASSESAITASNTLKTLQSLDAIARKSNAPVIMSFEDNADNSQRATVDENVRRTISFLSLLAYRTHHGLDTSDIRNWIYYPNVTDVPAQLAVLEIATTVDAVKQIPYPVTIASIHNGESRIGSVGADYQCYGLFQEATTIAGLDEIHYVVDVGAVAEIMKLVISDHDRLEERRRSRPKLSPLAADQADDNGMVL